MTVPRNHVKPGRMASLYRNAVLRQLSKLKHGVLKIQDPWGEVRIGEGRAGLFPEIRVHDPRFYKRVLFRGDLGAAESLMDGDWSSESLTETVRFFIRNMNLVDRLDRGVAHWSHLASRCVHWLRKNTLQGARRNISQHYDLGNDFYRLFLDDTMAYSSGVFQRPEATLYDASIAKFDRICRKMELSADDRVVEIGTGWGGWAIYAAEKYGCHVTTTTISQQQYEYATNLARQKGLEDRVSVLKQDYRDLEGVFDKLVSIEMIEAVGHRYFDEYFQTCQRLLKPDGLAVLQAILIRDQRYDAHLKSSDFIRQYIFPGGDLPSTRAILDSTSRHTDFRLLQYEELSDHYAETLRRWRASFCEQKSEVLKLGFDQRFIRMWLYYLCYCEAAFEERQVNSVQLTLARAHHQGDPISVAYKPESVSKNRCVQSTPNVMESLN